MEVVVEYPITVHDDNIGAILLPENTYLSQQTKDIYVRHQFIRDYVEDKTVKINFFRSEEKMEDLFTKNLSNGPFEFLTSKYVHHE